MDRRTHSFLGHEIEVMPFVRGALVSTVVALGLGVGVGSFVDEASNLAVVITALISVGFIAGGAVAGILSTRNHIIHGMLTSVPVAVLAVVVQLIRRVRSDDGAPWLGLIFIMFLATSLSTLGGVIGGRFSVNRRSLLQR